MTTVLSGVDAPASASALGGLRERLTGTVLRPQDPAFGAATRIWNAANQSGPRLVVRCAHGGDVAAAIRFARDQELPVAVRAGGWHPAGYGSGPGLVIDLRAMARVLVDPLAGTAQVGGGANWGAVEAATRRTGRTVPGLPWPAVGVAGSTLSGGFGEFRRAHGLACDSLVGADVVLADGRRVTTSGDELPELLWGLRGGGGNFGVVTALRFRLRPVPSPVLAGTVWYAGTSAAALLGRFRDYTAEVSTDVTSRLSLFGAGHPAVPSHLAGAPVAGVFATGAGPLARVAAEVAPLRTAAAVLADGLTARPTAAWPPNESTRLGAAVAVDSWYVGALSDELSDVLLARFEAMPPGAAAGLHVHHLGGAVARVAGMSSAVPHRTLPFLVSAQAGWRSPGQEPAAREWLAETSAALRAHAVGGPHPGLTSEPPPASVVYGAERYLRLAALKRRFDPDNVFAGNLNVCPLG